MTELLVRNWVGLWGAVLFLTARPLYRLHLKYLVPHRLRRLGVSLESLTCSFDRMVYLVPLPNHDPSVVQAVPADLMTEVRLSGWLFPSLAGVRVMLRLPDGGERQLAFMAAEHFTFPALDRLLLEGRIDARTYAEISACKLICPGTLQAMKEEALAQVRHAGRYA